MLIFFSLGPNIFGILSFLIYPCPIGICSLFPWIDHFLFEFLFSFRLRYHGIGLMPYSSFRLISSEIESSLVLRLGQYCSCCLMPWVSSPSRSLRIWAAQLISPRVSSQLYRICFSTRSQILEFETCDPCYYSWHHSKACQSYSTISRDAKIFYPVWFSPKLF